MVHTSSSAGERDPYEALIEETEDGRQFLIRDMNGVVAPFRLFL